MDLRKSIMKKTIDIHTELEGGVAVYLSNPTTRLKDVMDVSGTHHKNLDIIPVKIIPPNPAELLASDRLKQLFEEIKRAGYEYVIVDTAPAGIVADLYNLNPYANAVIFLTRANYTYKNSLLELQKFYQEDKLSNLTCVLNATTASKRHGYSYGYGYGYGYGDYKNNYYNEG
jgi:Mrp family chromosome partitioning ATPase